MQPDLFSKGDLQLGHRLAMNSLLLPSLSQVNSLLHGYSGCAALLHNLQKSCSHSGHVNVVLKFLTQMHLLCNFFKSTIPLQFGNGHYLRVPLLLATFKFLSMISYFLNASVSFPPNIVSISFLIGICLQV